MRVFIKIGNMPLVRLVPKEMKKIIKMVKATDGTYVAKSHQ